MNQTYIVKKGDTLYGISNQYGVSVIDLKNINNLKDETIVEGQQIMIPNNTGTNVDNYFNYTVLKGDTLYLLSKKYNTSIEEIKRLNNITSNLLSVGQVLKIPEIYNNDELTLPNYINYTVVKGDSLYSIAKNNNISIDVLKQDNNLSNNILSVGQVLKIRTNNFNEEILECFGEKYEIPINVEIEYIVQKGDSLYKIATKYNTSVDEIKKLNNITSNILSVGQVLKIPNNSINNNEYIVQKGDSLWSISQKFNTTVNEIKNKNNLSSNVLSIGQILYL